ncbi:hypothetical protein PpBr36_07250 [Pyricularia pennisetigena]|uniref:hypothetical protein n=1 Tax=Pyricularia pennisetigena TaxID=1578925 RepID=UPI00114F35DA|nr:hypothetical protein PpBr36_07250 [Pyricularia pennisetigena]TLS25859.1 hypothetical protein PpBr36_07250 [Pyricularia pennisetigena]
MSQQEPKPSPVAADMKHQENPQTMNGEGQLPAVSATKIAEDLSRATTDQGSHQSFRVIIVGGGPGGLLMAHMLSRAGIDWTLLERREDGGLVQPGTALALWPQAARVLDQLGLLEEAEKLYIPLVGKINFTKDGTVVGTSNMIERLGTNHGYPWMLFDRQVLMDFLFRRLPEQETRVQHGKCVSSIVSTPSEARITCTDGTVIHGSLIIGCDGVRSGVRRAMRDPATFPQGGLPVPRQGKKAKAVNDDEDDVMSAVFTGMAGHCSRPEGMAPQTVHEMHDWGLAILCMAGDDDAYFFVFKRLPKKDPISHRPRGDRTSSREEDLAALAAEVAERPVVAGGELRFRDVWAARTRATRLDFEEGFADEWHRGRLVLVSDAAAKMTPNAAFSLATGVQGMVDLTNRLRRLLLSTSQPSGEQLTNEVLAPYQKARQPMAKFVKDFSAGYTRTSSWSNKAWRFVDWLTPKIGGDAAMTDTMVASIVKRSIVLDFAEEKDYRVGKMPWKVGRMKEAPEMLTMGPRKKSFASSDEALGLASAQ